MSLEYPAVAGQRSAHPAHPERPEHAEHPILTGERMSTADILAALRQEWEILTRPGIEFAEMRGEFENTTYLAVNRYVTLCYFTVTGEIERSSPSPRAFAVVVRTRSSVWL